MKIKRTPLKDSFLIEIDVYSDKRGWFLELFNEKNFLKIKNKLIPFVQDNLSLSMKGTLRGLHFQKQPFEQAKLVTVLKGSVLDVIVDLRKESPSFGKYFSVKLSEENKKQLYIPRGFAHGFIALEDNTIFYYKVDNYYNKESESGINFKDKFLNINWNYDLNKIIITDKDKDLPFLKNE